MIEDIFKDYKKRICIYLNQFLDEVTPSLKKINPWGEDVVGRLRDFSQRGKMLRGGLVLFSYNMIGGKGADQDVLKLALAMELAHSALLIHDDIMDKDRLRRGQPTIYVQYEDKIEGNATFKEHFGQSMAICLGDIAFYLAFRLVNDLDQHRKDILNFFSDEMVTVGLGQMDDVAQGSQKKGIDLDFVERIYLYKTARYTFVLPMVMGAMIAGAPKKTIEQIEEFAQLLGVLFQVKDDELGLFADEGKIGKPVGSDIAENKKTIFSYHLFHKASEEDRVKLKTIFGNEDITQEDVDYVLSQMHELGVLDEVNAYTSDKQVRLYALIEEMEIVTEYRHLLKDFVDFNLKRNV